MQFKKMGEFSSRKRKGKEGKHSRINMMERTAPSSMAIRIESDRALLFAISYHLSKLGKDSISFPLAT